MSTPIPPPEHQPPSGFDSSISNGSICDHEFHSMGWEGLIDRFEAAVGEAGLDTWIERDLGSMEQELSDFRTKSTSPTVRGR